MPIEIDTIKRKTMYKKLKKGQNKKILKCYSYNKLSYFAKDYRLKNIILRPQFNIIRRVPITKERTLESNKLSLV